MEQNNTTQDAIFVTSDPVADQQVKEIVHLTNDLIRQSPQKEVVFRLAEQYVLSHGKLNRQSELLQFSNNSTEEIYGTLITKGFINSEDLPLLRELEQRVSTKENIRTSELIMNRFGYLKSSSEAIGVVDRLIYTLFPELFLKENPSKLTKDHNCDQCVDDCLYNYRYSAQWWYYYDEQYYYCKTYGYSSDCKGESKLYADSQMYAIYCENACAGDCEPEPCTECPPGFVFDGLNCYSGVHYPSGYKGFIYGRGFYTEQNCSISTDNECCPQGFTYDGANCHFFGKYFPSGATAFIYNRTFYVETICD